MDASGDFIPMDDDNQDLGASDKEWKDGYFDGTLNADALTTSGLITASSITATGTIIGGINISTTSAPSVSTAYTNTSYAAIVKSTISFTTVGAQSLVKLEYACGAQTNTSGNVMHLRAMRDDNVAGESAYTDMAATQFDGSVDWNTINGVVIDGPLAAGTYEYSLMALVSSGQITLNVNGWTPCTFTAMEVR